MIVGRQLAPLPSRTHFDPGKIAGLLLGCLERGAARELLLRKNEPSYRIECLSLPIFFSRSGGVWYILATFVYLRRSELFRIELGLYEGIFCNFFCKIYKELSRVFAAFKVGRGISHRVEFVKSADRSAPWP